MGPQRYLESTSPFQYGEVVYGSINIARIAQCSPLPQRRQEKDMEILKGIFDEYAATQILLAKDTCLHYHDPFSKEDDNLCALCQNETQTQDNDVL